MLSILLAACSGGAGTPTQAPGGGGGGGGQATPGAGPTDAAQATQSGGGGGGGGSKPAGWDQYGKVHIEISGPIQRSGDYGFVPVASVFGGSQGTSLNFIIEGENAVVSIASTEGKVVVSYGTEEFSAPGVECTTSNWNIGTTSASGSFECKALVILVSGATTQEATIKGSFDARAL